MAYVKTEGGVIIPASFAQAAQDAVARPEPREIATTRDGRDITRGFVQPLQLLQPQDSVLIARGAGNYSIYREVLRDDQVATVFSQRRRAVVAKKWEVEPGGKSANDKAAADFLREQLQAVRWDAVTEKMLYGVFYGYAVAECLWGIDGSFVTLEAIKVRDRRRFGYDGEMQLRLQTMAQPMPGELVPERKFWSFCTGADHDDEPYGLGLAHWLYWPVLFKKNGIKFWLIFLEKFGTPTAKGSYPGSATAEEKSRLLQAVMAITTDSGVILPEGMAIELIEAARSGTADYTELYDRMDRAIAKVVLGQTLTTEAVGGQYKAEVQMDVREDLVQSDADLVCESFNRSVARWLTEWNFPGAKVPRVWRQIEEGEDLEKRAKVDRELHDMGYEPADPEGYISDTYGGTWRKKAAPNDRSPRSRPGEPGAQFAAPGAGGAVVDQYADRLDEEARASLEALLEPVRRLVVSAESPDAIREGLVDLYPDMETATFARLLEEALTAAELAGRFEVALEAGETDAEPESK